MGPVRSSPGLLSLTPQSTLPSGAGAAGYPPSHPPTLPFPHQHPTATLFSQLGLQCSMLGKNIGATSILGYCKCNPDFRGCSLTLEIGEGAHLIPRLAEVSLQDIGSFVVSQQVGLGGGAMRQGRRGFLLFAPWPLVFMLYSSSPLSPSSRMASDSPQEFFLAICSYYHHVGCRGYNKRDVEFGETILESSGLLGTHLMLSAPRSIGEEISKPLIKLSP